MKLTHLAIHRMPGYKQRGFEFKDLFCMGLNVIYGSNGAGKSAACRAVRGILWPSSLKGQDPLSLSSVWHDGKDSFVIEIEGGFRYFKPERFQAVEGRLQDELQACGYLIGMEDLFDASDRDLAEKILREASGGCDTDKVLQEMALPARFGSKEVDMLLLRRKEAEEIKAELSGLAIKESELKFLEEKINGAREAGRQIEILREVRRFEEHRLRLALIDADLEAFLPQTKLLRGGEKERLFVYRQTQKELQGELEVVRERRAKAERQLAESGLENTCAPSREELALMRQTIVRFRSCENELRLTEKEIAAKEIWLKNELVFLRLDEEKLLQVDVGKLAETERLWEAKEQLQGHLGEIEIKLSMLQGAEVDEDVDKLREGLQIIARIKSIKFLVGFSYGVALLMMLQALWQMSALPAAIGLLPFGVILFYIRKLLRRYEQLQFPPIRYFGDSLQKQGVILEERRALALSQKGDAYIRSDLLSRQKDLKAQLSDLLKGSSLETFSMKGFLSSIKLAHDKLKEIIAQRQARAALQEEAEQYQEQLNAFFASDCASAFEYAAAEEALMRKMDLYNDARNALDALPEVIDRLEEKLKKTERDIAALLEPFGDEAQFIECGRQWEDYCGKQSEKKAMAAQLELLNKPLAGLSERKIEELKDKEEEYKQTADSMPVLIREKMTVEVEIKRAKSRRDMETARTKEQESVDKLHEVYEKKSLFDAAQHLIGTVKKRYDITCAPEILKAAKRYFVRFTHNAYVLHMPQKENGEALFYCKDVKTNEIKKLHELSRGTRMQLLLAVRLAFVFHKEAQALPLFFDEVLGITDEERFEAVAMVLVELVKEGRQIFYFTSQKADLQRFAAISGQAGLNDLALIDMERMKKEQLPKLLKLPEILQISLQEHFQTVAAIKADEDPAFVDAGYLLSTAEELQALTKARIHTYGQIRELFDNQTLEYILPGKSDKILEKGVLLDAFHAMYKVGRGRKLDRTVLEETGTGDAFLEKLLQLSKEVEHDAKRLVEVLKAKSDKRFKGFRVLNRLIALLLEKGYLDEAQTFSKEEIKLRLLQMAAKRGKLSGDEAISFLEKIMRAV